MVLKKTSQKRSSHNIDSGKVKITRKDRWIYTTVALLIQPLLHTALVTQLIIYFIYNLTSFAEITRQVVKPTLAINDQRHEFSRVTEIGFAQQLQCGMTSNCITTLIKHSASKTGISQKLLLS